MVGEHVRAKSYISIHALLAESDRGVHNAANHAIAFLSTLSLRRATAPLADRAQADATFLSTLSLRRATTTTMRCDTLQIFLSTLSLRRATEGQRPE